MMTTQLKTAKGDIVSLNRYGIADAARSRITAQILRTVIKPPQKQPVPPLVPNNVQPKRQS